MTKKKENIKDFFEGILNSYSQVFFAENKVFALLLLLISFFDLWTGISGLLSILIANTIAYILGYNRLKIKKGIYGFNPLLVGLGIGIYFAMEWNVLILIVLAAMLSFFISIVLEGFFSKYGLPFLSVPFLLSLWLLMLSFSSLQNFGLSQRDIYTANELYSIGGISLIKLYDWGNQLMAGSSLRTYFLSLGGIFFQFNIFSGIIIAFGLLIHSRIHFLLSLLGFYTAFLFYQFIGVPSVSLNYSYYGFNFILSAIAIGGYFLIPSKSSFLWTVLLIPVLVLITIATDKLFGYFHLSVYSLPFNLVVLGFVYALKLRIDKRGNLSEPIVQQKNPETNLYFYQNNRLRFGTGFSLPVNLPFYGKWTINQGHNGKYTHKNEWQHAWDFVIKDNNGKEYSGNGNNLSDFYCYEKTLIAPADGTIIEIIDSVEDNPAGETNLKDNWGNSVVIQHTTGLYSQMSHIKKGSFKVSKGQFVRKGQGIAMVGNSGRSPFPHLHFQFQASPFVGSKTLKYSIQNFIRFSQKQTHYVNSGIPQENQTIANISPHYLLQRAFNWVPGKKLKFKQKTATGTETVIFEVNATIYNQPYLYHAGTNAYLYFRNDKNLFFVENYTGSKHSPLFLLYLSLYKIPLGYIPDFHLVDAVSVHHIFPASTLRIQDFIAPFHLFLSANYQITGIEADNEMNTKQIRILSQLNAKTGKKEKMIYNFVILLNEKNIQSIEISNNNKKTLLEWVED